jgi:hypothetical protein
MAKTSGSSVITPASIRDRSSSSVTRPAEPLGLRQRGAQRHRVGLRNPVHDVLQHGLQRGDRRAQLVGDVGDQLASLLVGGLQVGRHLVERQCQLADLVTGGGPDPAAVVALRHGTGGGGHLPQRPGHSVRQDLRGHQHDRQRRQRRGGGRHPVVDVPQVEQTRPTGGEQQHGDLELDPRDRVERAGEQVGDRREPARHGRHRGTSRA